MDVSAPPPRAGQSATLAVAEVVAEADGEPPRLDSGAQAEESVDGRPGVPWWLLLVGLGIVAGLVLVFPERTYDGSDDATMAAIVNGTYGLGPDGHAVFINYGLGAILATLGRILPGPGWYGIFLWTVVGISLGAFGLFLHRSGARGAVAALGVVTILSVAFPLVVLINFTTTSMLAAGVAVVGVVVTAGDDRPGDGWLLLLATLLFVVAVLLRFNGAAAAILVAVPALAAAAGRDVRRTPLLLLAWGLLAGALYLGDSLAYMGEGWAEFRAWTSARSDLLDYRVANADQVRAAAGWSVADWRAFRASGYFDPGIHGPGPMSAAAAVAVRTGSGVELRELLSGALLWIAVSLATVGAALAGPFRRSGRRLALAAPIGVGWTWAVSWFVASSRFRWRSFDGMMLAGLLAAIAAVWVAGRPGLRPRDHASATVRTASTSGEPDGPDGGWQRRVVGATLLVILVAPFAATHVQDRAPNTGRASSRARMAQAVADLEDVGSTVFLGESLALPDNWDPLRADDTWSRVDYLAPGWYAFSPVWEQRRDRLGVSDPPWSLLDDPDRLYLTRGNAPPRYLLDMFAEHRGQDVQACFVPLGPTSISAWELRSVDQPC